MKIVRKVIYNVSVLIMNGLLNNNTRGSVLLKFKIVIPQYSIMGIKNGLDEFQTIFLIIITVCIIIKRMLTRICGVFLLHC